MENKYIILVINPGSTSTKTAIFENEVNLVSDIIYHDPIEINKYDSVYSQYEMRYNGIMKKLKERNINLFELTAVIGRGGYIRPVKSGTYKVNDLMLEELRNAKNGEHASNLGAILAAEFSKEFRIPAYITDPTVVDEMSRIAKLTGLPEYRRLSRWHPLNQKICARKGAIEIGKTYEKANIIVAHLGGGITVGAHEKGVAVDVNDGLLGDGPFSLNRPGGLPTIAVMDLCFKEGASLESVKKKLLGNAGIFAYCQTEDCREIEEEIEKGNTDYELVYKAMAYNIAKEIGKCAVVLKGNVDAIILTGGIAYSRRMVDWITEYAGFLGRIILYPGGYEMEAMAEAVTRVLNGTDIAIEYI